MFRLSVLGLAIIAGSAMGAATLNALTGQQFRSYPGEYRADVTNVTVSNLSHPCVRMKSGETIVYSWEVQGIGDTQVFYSDFHTHAAHTADMPGDMMSYRRLWGSKASGSLVAPWDGIHCWYWENKSNAPVVVQLRIAGFYERIVADSELRDYFR